MNQALRDSNFSSVASSPLSAFNWRELGPCCGLGFFLQEYYGWLNLLHTTKIFPTSVIRLFFFSFLTICVFTGVALLISFKKFSFAFRTWLIICYKRPCFWLILAFDMPFSLSLIFSIFWFKVRDVQLFLSAEHSEVTVRLLIGLISIFSHLRK